MISIFDNKLTDYINSPQIYPNIIPDCPIEELKNIIMFGISGSGKYTYALKLINKYSTTGLKYEKKISIPFNKEQYYIKISDIHYEIDMSLLGCNAKLLWNEIYQHIIDIVYSKKSKQGIILCKNFHEIQPDLLQNFYSYFQLHTQKLRPHKTMNIVFIILTQHISFIPDNIVNFCSVVNFPRLINDDYKKIGINMLGNNIKSTENIIVEVADDKIVNKHTDNCIAIDNDGDCDDDNDDVEEKCDNKNKKYETEILNIKDAIYDNTLTPQQRKFKTKIKKIKSIDKIVSKTLKTIFDKNDKIQFLNVRENNYNIFIYNVDVAEFVWKILNGVLKNWDGSVETEKISRLLVSVFTFFRYFNNNYRPQSHIELFVYNLMSIMNDWKQ